MEVHRRRISAPALLLAFIATTSFLFARSTDSSLTDYFSENDRSARRLMDKTLARFSDPKSLSLRDPSPVANHESSPRKNCQIVYVLGVEGSIHHGFIPVITSLAQQQADPITGTPYDVVKGHEALRATIFGSDTHDLPLNDPDLVQTTLDQMCPSPLESWRHHIVIEGNSFPSGSADNELLHFRVRRQKDWNGMTPEEIAATESALNHPTNLYQFYEAFSPYVDIKFIVLHRPYVETIASHLGFDNGPEGHSTVISGFLILLSRFLMGHMYDSDTGAAAGGGRDGAPLWTTVCADKLSSKQYDTQEQLNEAREHVLGYLASFLGWPQRSCTRCFDLWKESSKAWAKERILDDPGNVLLGHVKALQGVWPPKRREDDLPEQQCTM